MSKKKVAWVVSDGDYGAVVIFHHHGLAARREGAETLGVDFEDVECRRSKELDKYVNATELSYETLVKKHGWWIECCYCGASLYNDDVAAWKNGYAYCKKCNKSKPIDDDE